MAVSLAGIDLNPNLYLEDVDDDPLVFNSVRNLLGGNNVVQIQPKISGPLMRLTAFGPNPRIGWFCQNQFDSFRTLARAGNAVTLVHDRVGTIQVQILAIEDVDQLDTNIPQSNPNKRFSGSIILQEV